MHNNLLLAQPSDEKLYVEDVFSTYLYTGNGSTQTITNGIDLAGKGGAVWIKDRTNAGATDPNHYFTSSDTSFTKTLTPNSTSASINYSALQSVSNTGFVDKAGWPSGNPMVSWTFRKAPKFFDVVTYTGNGSTSLRVPHSLGVVPGMIIIKRVDSTSNWGVFHIGNGSTTNYYRLSLNSTSSGLSGNLSGLHTSTVFAPDYVYDHNSAAFNTAGASYVAYLFAHDTTADGVIQCGTFSASSATTVNLGWEPQYVLLKQSSGAQSWYVVDTMRNLSFTAFPFLQPNTADAETDAGVVIEPTPTGFTFKGANLGMTGGQTYVYMAIRRGPMRVPTDATKVFKPVSNTTYSVYTNAGFPVDFFIEAYRSGGQYNDSLVFDRLRGAGRPLFTSLASAESSGYDAAVFNSSTGVKGSFNSPNAIWHFRRAPGFFDVVCYTGTGNQTTRSHGLKAIPELIIVKSRSFNGGNGNWYVYHSALSDKAILLNSASSAFSSPLFAYGNHTDTYFSVLSNMDSYVGVNDSGQPYVAYLFASCPGVSKVGTYTGNGSSLNIDCGFTNGARFVLIKQSNGYTDWYVWDTARGIVAANDPHLSLNNTNTEVTTNDSIDPLSSGFTVNQNATTNINASGGTYIYLAIA